MGVRLLGPVLDEAWVERVLSRIRTDVKEVELNGFAMNEAGVKGVELDEVELNRV